MTEDAARCDTQCRVVTNTQSVPGREEGTEAGTDLGAGTAGQTGAQPAQQPGRVLLYERWVYMYIVMFLNCFQVW